MWGKQLIGFISIIIAVATYFLLPQSCPENARRTAAVFIIAALFWGLEILPLFATSLLTVILLSLFLFHEYSYTIFLSPFASPILFLFFGGFVLAEALHKHGVDTFLAVRILSFLEKRSGSLLLGVMAMTAFVSMWISNTATTVIILGILQPLLFSETIPLVKRKQLILAVAFSANIGGIATPIGSPPNAIAIGGLTNIGISISFLKWMILCVPLTILCLAIAWVVLTYFYGKEEKRSFRLSADPLSKKGKYTLVIATLMVVFWLSSPVHKLPEALIALIGVTVLAAAKLIDQESLRQIKWDILILMWGGLSLGVGLEASGLGKWIIDTFFFTTSPFLLILIFGVICLVISGFISNTATASLLVPIGLQAGQVNPEIFAITIALISSTGMALPISTPPNAIVYGSELVTNKEIAQAGVIITLFCFFIILVGFWWIIPLFF